MSTYHAIPYDNSLTITVILARRLLAAEPKLLVFSSNAQSGLAMAVNIFLMSGDVQQILSNTSTIRVQAVLVESAGTVLVSVCKPCDLTLHSCCQIADLHGVVSKALGFSKELKSGTDKFLVLKLSPEPGQWVEEGSQSWHPKISGNLWESERQVQAEVPTSFAAVASSPEGMEIRPPGLQIELCLAGIEVHFTC